MEIIFLKLTLIPLPIIYTHAKTAKPAVSYIPVFMLCQQMKKNKNFTLHFDLFLDLYRRKTKKKIY